MKPGPSSKSCSVCTIVTLSQLLSITAQRLGAGNKRREGPRGEDSLGWQERKEGISLWMAKSFKSLSGDASEHVCRISTVEN